MTGREPIYGPEFDAPNVTRSAAPSRHTLDPRALSAPPLHVKVTYTGTDPAVAAVLRGRTSKAAGVVYAVDGTGNIAQVRMHSGVAFIVGETLDNETAGGTITADAVSLADNTPIHLTQRILGDTGLGRGGYLGKYATPALARRRCELQANNLSTTFKALGWESGLTLTGTLSNQQRNFGPSIRFTTPTAAVGDWAGLRGTGLNTHAWKWDPLLAVQLRVQTFTNARIWFALSNVALNAVQTPSGAGNRVVGYRWDGGVDNNIHAITWDGTTLIDQNVFQGNSNTLYVPSIEIDKLTGQARFNLYDWQLGTSYGLVHSATYATAAADRWDVEIVVEVVSGASTQQIELSRVILEHD